MRLSTADDRKQYRAAMIPQGSVRDPRSTENAEVYSYEIAGAPYAKGFSGSAGKPSFFYRFRSESSREQHIVEFFANEQAKKDYKRTLSEQKKAFKHTLTIGQLMHGSWGYDQTNCELWEVTALIGKCMVELRKVKCEAVPDSAGFMSESVRPLKGQYCEREAPVKARVKEGNYCRVNRCCSVSPTNENDKHYSSWYA